MASLKPPRFETHDKEDVNFAHTRVLHFVEKTFNGIISELESRPFGDPQVTIQRITSVDLSRGRLGNPQSDIEGREITYRWPGNTKDEAWRFACVGRILFEIYIAIQAGIIVTKRDIYYREPELFKRQETVDRYVDDIAFTCQVTRRDLNIAASPKGLIAIPHNKVDIIQDTPDLAYCDDISHAVFKTLIECGFHNSSSKGRGILITGRGYPDLATRQCVHLYSTKCANAPIYGLFDADPDGLDIFRCYVTGSKALAQETSCTVPRMTLLGLKLTDAEKDACISMTIRDRTKARSMLESGIFLCHTSVSECRVLLQQMLMLNKKAEIQAVPALKDWLESKL